MTHNILPVPRYVYILELDVKCCFAGLFHNYNTISSLLSFPAQRKENVNGKIFNQTAITGTDILPTVDFTKALICGIWGGTGRTMSCRMRCTDQWKIIDADEDHTQICATLYQQVDGPVPIVPSATARFTGIAD